MTQPDPPDSLEALAAEVQALHDSSRPSMPAARAPTMGNLPKLRYTHEAMIDLIIANPGISQNQLAATFGYTPGWVSNIMASDAFQAKLAGRRREVIDPTIVATLEERIRGLAFQSLEVLKRKLDEPACKPEVALRAFELGAKGLGLGGHAVPAPIPIDLDRLAERLTALNPNRPRTFEGEVTDVKEVVNG